ncbi:hypothetical protein P22_1156 [Propionispora sp. 2/2-37]|uniref:glycosyltransferase family 2 protein n=1 Tax=Propionispora sp. 2/2-37 TaxID=1677858 RepID=UPI0006BB7453|nr:glycosyltransferase [Propionispora sp. 2/2-37]CUH95087.1 hypothetical protein P22_1156 [Propionispora sp. 2/2-37]
MARGKLPLVSIGLPVYNGERYIRQTIENLLGQDYRNFELIICDNASSDLTYTICREYATKDTRIQLYQNSDNLGSARNFNKVFTLSSGKYFMWAAHDDVWGQSYIGKGVAKLEDNPSAIMCTTDTQHIDPAGNKLGIQIVTETVGMDMVQRVQRFMSYLGGFIIYGLIRSEILKQTNLFQAKFGPDVILLMELLLLGEFVKVPEVLFWYRYVVKPLDQYMNFIAPGTVLVKKPCTGLMRDMFQVIRQAQCPESEIKKMEKTFVENLLADNLHWKKQIILENKDILKKQGLTQEFIYSFIAN